MATGLSSRADSTPRESIAMGPCPVVSSYAGILVADSQSSVTVGERAG